MELNEIKNWSYEKLDNAIVLNKNSIDFNEKEIARLNTEVTKLKSEIKMLREVKSQKTMTDSLNMITDLGIDFSLDDLKSFLQSKKNNAATENGQN